MTRTDLARADEIGSGIPSGTSFPGTPSTDDLFDRTDLDGIFRYDGTRWLSATLYDTPIEFVGARGVLEGLPANVTATAWRMTVPRAGGNDLWMVDVTLAFLVSGGTALSGSHKWDLAITSQPANTSLATLAINSGSLNVWRNSGQIAVGALVGTTNFQIQMAATKTGTPGELYAMPRLTYRIVGT